MATKTKPDDNAPKEAKAVKALAEGKPPTATLRGSAWLPTVTGRFLARTAAVAGVEALTDGTTAVHLLSGGRVVVTGEAGAVVAALAKAERE